MVNEHLEYGGIEVHIQPHGVYIRTIPEWFVVDRNIVELYSLILGEFLPEKCMFEFRIENPIARSPPVVDEISEEERAKELTRYLKKIGAENIETKIFPIYDEDSCFVKCIILKEAASLLLYSLYLGWIRHHFEITGITIREKIEKENNFSFLEYELNLLDKLIREQKENRDYSKIWVKLANISDNIIFHDRGFDGGSFFISNEKLKEKFIRKLDEFAKYLDTDITKKYENK